MMNGDPSDNLTIRRKGWRVCKGEDLHVHYKVRSLLVLAYDATDMTDEGPMLNRVQNSSNSGGGGCY